MLAVVAARFPSTDPRVFAELIVLVAYITSVPLLYLVLDHFRLRYPAYCSLLFAMFPLVGLTRSVMPRVNAVIFFWLFLGLLFYVKERRWYAVAALAICLLTHKSVWPVVFFLAVIGVFDKKLTLIQAVAIFVPLSVYWLFGISYHGDALWLIRDSFRIKASNEGFLPFIGLLDALQRASGSLMQLLREQGLL